MFPELWPVTVIPREGFTVSFQRSKVKCDGSGVTGGTLEEVSFVLGLKTLAGFPQSRGESLREHSYEGGVRED